MIKNLEVEFKPAESFNIEEFNTNISDTKNMTDSRENKSVHEQRSEPRKAYLKTVKIHFQNRIITGMIHNISSCGVYIESHELFHVGEKIKISYFGSDNQNEIEIWGKIIWTKNNGFALQYI